MRVTIKDIEWLIEAFFQVDDMTTAYLDAMTGEILFFNSENIGRWSKSLYDELDKGEADNLNSNENESDEIQSLREMSEKKADIEDNRELWNSMELDPSGRYILIDPFESWQSYNIMKNFIEDISDTTLQEKLSRAINGKGAFGRFKEVLLDYPVWREKWFTYEQEAKIELIREYFEDHDLELKY